MSECCGRELKFERMDVSVEQAHCPGCGAYYQRRDGGKVLYKTVNQGDDWACAECGAEIEGERVYHPIHDGPFPLSGSGKVYVEVVPWCPNCEQKPNERGKPISSDPRG